MRIRYAALSLPLAIAVLLSGCGKKAPTEEPDTAYDTMSVMESVTESKSTETTAQTQSAPEGQGTTDSSEVPPGEIPMDALRSEPGRTALDKDGITVVEEGPVDSAMKGRGIALRFTNSNDYPVRIYAPDIVANEFTTPETLGFIIRPNDEVTCSIFAYYGYLSTAGVKSVWQLRADVTAFNAETEDELWEQELVFETGDRGEGDDADTSVFGDLVYDGEEAAVYARFAEDGDYWETGIVFTVLNKGDADLCIECEEAYADGEYMPAMLNMTAKPGTFVMGDQPYSASALRENDMDGFTEASAVLGFCDSEGNILGTTDMITLKVPGSS